jgi:hypothetical protein
MAGSSRVALRGIDLTSQSTLVGLLTDGDVPLGAGENAGGGLNVMPGFAGMTTGGLTMLGV